MKDSLLKQSLGTGIMGQISWERLSRMLRDTGEITAYEKIVGYEVDSNFLRFKVERND